MGVPVWAAELAARFWSVRPPARPTFDELEDRILDFGPTCERLPGLTVGSADAWLRGRRWAAGLPGDPRRRLRGCLVMNGGIGYVLIDADDPPDERRYTLAHEAGHLLHDYHRPRDRARARFGDDILRVLDGKRPPNDDERLGGLLANVPIGPHAHLLERGRAASAEEDADRLAFELLAPFAAVRPHLAAGRAGLSTVLVEQFGLPPERAAVYARRLLPDRRIACWSVAGL